MCYIRKVHRKRKTKRKMCVTYVKYIERERKKMCVTYVEYIERE